ncbi:MAG: hypothetical protein IID17_10620 [Nitrospinae bacterium]|nr:hypothetical protein [Nitrospinota bacterium]
MRKFLRNNLLILVLLNSSNIFSYLFQLVAGRTLTTIDYGTFNAVNSLAVILSAPVAVLPLVFSRYTVKLEIAWVRSRAFWWKVSVEWFQSLSLCF